MVTFKNLSRFYSRTSGGKYQLVVSEIRAAFIAAETAYERVRRVRTERILKAVARETPAPIFDDALVMFHALPTAHADEVWQRVLAMSEHDLGIALHPIIGAADDWTFNLDGFLTYRHGNSCYLQLFRDGGLETLGRMPKDESRGGFYGWGLEEAAINRFRQYQGLWQRLDVTAPLLVGLTLLGMKGWKVLGAPSPFGERDGALDRDVVVTPEVIVSDLNTPADIALKPLCDFVWNGGGWPASPNYREGRRVRPA